MQPAAPSAVSNRLLGARSLIVLGVLLVLALITGGGYAIRLVARRTETAVLVHARNLHDCDGMAEAYQRKLAAWRGYLLSRDPALLGERDAADALMQQKLDLMRVRLRGEEAGLLRAVERARGAHERASHEIELQMRAGMDLDSIARSWTAVGLPLSDDARAAVRELQGALERRHAHAEVDAETAERLGFIVLAGITIGVVLLGGIGGLVLARGARERQRAEARVQEEMAARVVAETAARHEAESARNFYGALLDELPIGFIAAEAPSGRVLHVSANAAPILRGSAAAEERDVSASWETASHLDGRAYVPADLPLARALRGEVVRREEVRTAEGRIIVCSAAPIRGDDGEVVAAALAFTDATAERDAEAERELFLGALGHDLRNPLNAISMSASSMSGDQTADERTRRKGARIVRAADRLLRLFDQLLDFVKSRHGGLPIQTSLCDLHDIAREVIATIEPGSPDTTLRLERKGRGIGNWDRDRISQVLQNLIGNAVQHGENGAPVVVRITDCDGASCIEVINHGPPIPQHLLPHLFEPFRRGQSGTGLGLGLYVAHAIVTAHGGTLEVESGETTTFRARLPADATPAAAAAAPA